MSNIHSALPSPVELASLITSKQLNRLEQEQFAQYFTSLPIARFMASLFTIDKSELTILDAGAGVGILSAALIEHIIQQKAMLNKIKLLAFETDQSLVTRLGNTLNLCAAACEQANITFEYTVYNQDFIEAGVNNIKAEQALFSTPAFSERFDLIIMNPPYKKINSISRTRQLLDSVHIETSNLYAAFLALSFRLLKSGGQIVAITPRSFTNGPYFKAFRKLFYRDMRFAQIHVFNSRSLAFQDDDVLQENIIFSAYKDKQRDRVIISTSDAPEDEALTQIRLNHHHIINPNDPDKVIHLITDGIAEKVIGRINMLACTLSDLDLEASTGRVVDFRVAQFLRNEEGADTYPLIYPLHFSRGLVAWPKHSQKKSEALVYNNETKELFLDSGYYVVCRRFSSKEERKRIVAALYDPLKVKQERVGFENHLNVFHRRQKGLIEQEARGLTVFLNSTILDLYFRIFNGHTQVNAADLRMLRYPTKEQLIKLGGYFLEELPDQNEIDEIIEKELFAMAKDINPVKIAKKIKEALALLKELGIPKAQQNESSALALLALLNIEPTVSWQKAGAPLLGITEMMNFFKDHYGKEYAPNSRETVRRFTVHQFVQAGLVIPNPDKPRPINSPQYVYQIEPSALKLIREYGSKSWNEHLQAYLTSIKTLQQMYAQERDTQRIPINLKNNQLSLSPGGQNVLIKKIVEEFCSIFTPDAEPVYIGDTEKKWAYFDMPLLRQLGINPPDEHGKMPDVVIFYKDKNWLVLIEAVTSHGPINPKRRIELEELHKNSTAGLVFVTAFLDRKGLLQYLNDIAWETEVWVAESPTHIIHFNGKRFLGPYT